MPNRIIREGILTSRRVDQLDEMAELFYRRLQSVVDDFGRYFGETVLLRTACYPRRPARYSLEQVDEWIIQCAAAELLTAYEVDGCEYVELTDFNQRIRDNQKSKFPANCGVSREVPADSRKVLTMAGSSRSRATTPTPTPTTPPTPASTTPSEKKENLDSEKSLAVVDDRDNPVSILDELEPIYAAAGAPIPPKHRETAIRLILGIEPPELRRRVTQYVKWALVSKKWPTAAKTKALVGVLNDGDWNIEITPEMLRRIREPTKAESAQAEAAAMFRRQREQHEERL